MNLNSNQLGSSRSRRTIIAALSVVSLFALHGCVYVGGCGSWGGGGGWGGGWHGGGWHGGGRCEVTPAPQLNGGADAASLSVLSLADVLAVEAMA